MITVETPRGALYTSKLFCFEGILRYEYKKSKKISEKLIMELKKQRISKSKLARMCGVSRDTVLRYTSIKTKDESMDVIILKRMERVLYLPQYGLCTRYHVFLDSEDGGQWLFRKRKICNMTQSEFAQKLMVSLQNYKNYEKGRVKIPYEVWKKGAK